MDQRPSELEEIKGADSADEMRDADALATRSETDLETYRAETAADAEASTDETADEPEEIREQIEQTRSQMSETIDAIQEKLSFSNISEQVKEGVSEQINSAVSTAKDVVYDATIRKAENFMQTVTKGLSGASESMGDAGTYVVSAARRNPVPFALIGLGIGLVLWQNNRRKTTTKYRYDYENESDYSSGRQDYSSARQSYRSGGKTMFRQAGETVTGALGSARDAAGNVAGSAYEGVSSAASSAYGGVTSAAGSAYEGASNFVSSTGQQATQVARKVQNQYEQTLEENPLAIGAVALALGAVVGLAIPVSEYENQWMGETKDNLVQSVETAARGAIEKVQEVAGEVSKQVKEQAKGGSA